MATAGVGTNITSDSINLFCSRITLQARLNRKHDTVEV